MVSLKSLVTLSMGLNLATVGASTSCEDCSNKVQKLQSEIQSKDRTINELTQKLALNASSKKSDNKNGYLTDYWQKTQRLTTLLSRNIIEPHYNPIMNNVNTAYTTGFKVLSMLYSDVFLFGSQMAKEGYSTFLVVYYDQIFPLQDIMIIEANQFYDQQLSMHFKPVFKVVEEPKKTSFTVGIRILHCC